MNYIWNVDLFIRIALVPNWCERDRSEIPLHSIKYKLQEVNPEAVNETVSRALRPCIWKEEKIDLKNKNR